MSSKKAVVYRGPAVQLTRVPQAYTAGTKKSQPNMADWKAATAANTQAERAAQMEQKELAVAQLASVLRREGYSAVKALEISVKVVNGKLLTAEDDLAATKAARLVADLTR